MTSGWLWANYAIAVLSLILFVIIVLVSVKRLTQHFFFVFFYFSTVVYLQIAPTLSLLEQSHEDMELVGIAGPSAYLREYALVGLACLLLFQVPFALLYLGLTRRKVHTTSVVVSPMGSRWVACAGVLIALLVLRTIVANNLLFTRIGSEGAAAAVVGLSNFDFFVFRLYQESAFFLVGVLFFIRQKALGFTRRLAFVALSLNVLLFGSTALLNSRWTVTMFVVYVVGWWLATRQRKMFVRRQLIGIAAAGLVAAGLMVVVVNNRNDPDQGLRWQHLNPFATTIFSDTAGFNRLNGIDLMARLLPEITARGPAWGAAWQGSTWLVRRFIDPSDFDTFRLSLGTTAKSYLMRTYLGWPFPDYYSCTLTDFFGNFHFLGMVVAASVLGVAFAFCRNIHRPQNGSYLILALFVLTHVLPFEQEGGTLLFGWVRQLPLLLLLVAMRPFRRARGKLTSSRVNPIPHDSPISHASR